MSEQANRRRPGSSGGSSGRTPVLRWADHVGGGALWAIGIIVVAAHGVIGFLAVANWQQEVFALQVVSMLTIMIGFTVLLWGGWAGLASSVAAALVSLVVTVLAGRRSLESGIPFERMPFFIEALLFFATAYLCVQFMEREEMEETADQRQLDRLESDYLELAKRYGNREELLRILEKKEGRLKHIEGMGERLHASGLNQTQAIQICLAEVVETVGKGEAEVTLYAKAGVVRHVRGVDPIASQGIAGDFADNAEAGFDEIDRWLKENQNALLVNNLTHDMRFPREFGRSLEVVSVIAVPLVWGDAVRGTLRLTSVVPQAFSHEDLRFASEAARVLLPVLVRGEGEDRLSSGGTPC